MKANPRGGQLDILAAEDLQAVHEAALALLADVGVFSESDLILDLFARHGAPVDRERRVICVPREMVQAALNSAPHGLTVHGRDPAFDLLVEEGRAYFGLGGTSEPFIYDYDLGRPRSPTKADMIAVTRVGQALPNVNFIMALCSARDVPVEHVFFHEYDAIFRNTTKPVIVSAVGLRSTRRFLEMAAAATGSEEEFRRRPWVIAYVTPVSPLQVTHHQEGIFAAAEYDVPIQYSPGPMMGATGPATVAGDLVQSSAETLFGLAMSQLIKPGIPFIFAPHVPAMDMATGQCTYGSVEQAIGRAAVGQLGRMYGLPTFNTGAGSEAKLPDAEAASQAMMGMLLNGLAGLNLTQTMGTLASGLYGSLEMLAICDELALMVKRVLRGITVNHATLALDVIRQVGHGGQYLMQEHTLQNFRQEMFFPDLFRRQSIQQWEQRGAKSITEVAHERVQEILAKAEPALLPAGAEAELERVLQLALAETRERALTV